MNNIFFEKNAEVIILIGFIMGSITVLIDLI